MVFRVIRALVRHVKYFLGLRFDVSGLEHLQTEGPYVIISNHQSSLDVLGRRHTQMDERTDTLTDAHLRAHTHSFE